MMNSQSTASMNQALRRMMAFMLSLLLIPATQLDLYAQDAQSAYVELDAVQLDQLVAPIALYPDSLVAQILTAATYPDQVAAADTWLNQNMNLPPDQRAAGANAMDWDPAVKGLTAFPSALDNLAKNTAWAAQLGNAYYNQPGDVMNAVQAMRLQAQQSKTLVDTPQQRVVVDAGVVSIVPVDPAVVYVPYYDPWRFWGSSFVAYPGYALLPPPPGFVVGVGLGFFAGISIGAYAHFGWGFGAWSPGWRGGTVIFNHNTYISHSTTVFNHGNFGGHDRGAFDHGGRGVPGGFHAVANRGAARAAAARAGARGGPGGGRALGNRGAAGGRGPAGHGPATASHRAAPASHAAANHGGAAGHGAPASHGAAANHRAAASHAPASHGAAASHGGAASHGAPASHGGAAGHGAPASHGGGHGAPAGHSGGGHAPAGNKKPGGKGK